MHALLALLPLAARYQLCNFSCAADEQQWLSCRSEKCTPRMAEDFCKDGSEATLSPAFGDTSENAATEGFTVTGPQECEELLGQEVPKFGSFEERCELCMGVVVNTIQIMRLGMSRGGKGEEALRNEGVAAVCEQAVEDMNTTIPTIRTCRYHSPACSWIMDAAKQTVCPPAYTEMLAGASGRTVRAAQQSVCGQMMTQRNGSGVEAATLCPVPRDIGQRVMIISAVVGATTFFLQWLLWRGRLIRPDQIPIDDRHPADQQEAEQKALARRKRD